MGLSDVLEVKPVTISAPQPPDLSNIDAMSGEDLNPPAAAAPVGVPANNSFDQAEQARVQNNQAAAAAGLPQTPAPPPQLPPAAPRPPQGAAAMQGEGGGPVQGVGAYGGGQGAPQGGDTSPLTQLAMRQAMQGGPGRQAGYVPQQRTAEASPVRPEAEQAVGDLEQARIDQARMQQRLMVAQGQELAPLQQRQAAEQQKLLADTHASLAEHVQKIQQLTDNASKAAHEEPEDFWGGQNVGTHIMRTLGMALLAFGHSKNPNGIDPMAYMNTMIKQAADKQKAKVDAAKGDLDREQNLYALMKQKFGDDQSALTATQMLQKQAVLDGIDAHFAPPAKRTWGGEDEHEDPYASLPPTAALGLANARVALAQDIAKDQLDLDKAHVGKITSTEHYQQAVAGGPGNVLQALRAGAEATKLQGEIATGGRQAEAGVRKTEAEAAVEEGKSKEGGPGQVQTQLGGAPPAGINPTEHPLNYLESFLPGSKVAIDRQAYKSAVLGVLHKNVNLKSPELLKELSTAYEPHTLDTDETLRYRFQKLLEQYGHGGPASGGAPGEQVDVENGP